MIPGQMSRLPAAVFLVTTVAATLAPRAAQNTPPSGAGRIVAIGDIHGAAEAFREILRSASLIDGAGRWIGGTAVLVQTGDYLDRGDGVRDVMDLLMRLEVEAREAGGRVEVLFGNHEAMNLLHDLRDVSEKAYARFADSSSEERRQRAYDAYEEVMKRGSSDGRRVATRARWMAAHPPGFLEYVEALGPKGHYGRWLRARKVVVEERGTIFMHAGVPPDWTGTLEDVNQTAARDVSGWDAARELMEEAGLILPFFDFLETAEAAVAELRRMTAAVNAGQPPGEHVTRELVEALLAVTRINSSTLMAPEGPLWFRGFATWPETNGPAVTALLQRFGSVRFVGGHTPFPGRIATRFGHRVFLIDTGMLSSVYRGGRASALELHDGRITAIYPRSRQVLVAGSRAVAGSSRQSR